jgi:hypothetical protein
MTSEDDQNDMKDMRGPLLQELRKRVDGDVVDFYNTSASLWAITCALLEVAASNDRIVSAVSRLEGLLRSVKAPDLDGGRDAK